MISLEVAGLSKVYRLYNSPAQRLKEIVFRKPLHTKFVALENVSFSVQKGETFGIIGENGAGKSTLMKILAKTLKPTDGTVELKGRVAALLELGAGFNPELSGEENIFLNAYLMGLSQREIEMKKEEVIDFSELGSFISRPVKTYSSGMHVRLAFSIAVCVDPEILIVDEALSVGDQHFQKKCIDRMMQFKNRGKTIVFCSHALYFVQELCERAIWLHHGRPVQIGEASKVINAYNDWSREKDAGVSTSVQAAEAPIPDQEAKPVVIEKVKMTDRDGSEHDVIRTGDEVRVTIRISVTDPREHCKGHFAVALTRNDEQTVFGLTTKMESLPAVSFHDGMEVSIQFPVLPLLQGQYYFSAAVMDEHAIHLYDTGRTRMFSVENLGGELGIVKLKHEWGLKGRDNQNGK